MTKQLVPVDNFKQLLSSDLVSEQLQNALGENAAVFTASLLDAYIGGLSKYDAENIIQEAMKAAVLNLPIAPSLGFAYLVPFKGKITFILGYKGLIQLAMRSGQVKTINAGPVFDGELRKIDKLKGHYDLSGKAKSDQSIGYFAYMELKNGFEKTVFWEKPDVIKHAEAKSPSYKNKSSAWHTDFDAMATKTVIRALFSKYAPMTIDFQRALEFDEPEEKDITQEVNTNSKKFISKNKNFEVKPERPIETIKKEPDASPRSENNAHPPTIDPALIELADWMESDGFARDYSELAKENALTMDLIKEAQLDKTGRKAKDVLELIKGWK